MEWLGWGLVVCGALRLLFGWVYGGWDCWGLIMSSLIWVFAGSWCNIVSLGVGWV